MILTT
jgi:2-oxoisovalerate dehydrogenase E1 component alpha subunit